MPHRFKGERTLMRTFIVETEEAIQAVLPDLDTMIGGGLVTLEAARVILYRPQGVPESERWKHRIEGLEGAQDTEGSDSNANRAISTSTSASGVRRLGSPASSK